MCAIEAGKRGRKVAVLEHNDSVGKKIRISGGGRCNFTNRETTADNFLSANPNFAKSALSRYPPEKFIDLVRSHGIAFHEKKLGQLFCDRSSQQIIDLLLNECRAAGVEILTGSAVSEIRRPAEFQVSVNGRELSCDSLVIASGGLSIPTIGASGFGYRIATQFGIGITTVAPGLVPLTFDGVEGRIFNEHSGLAFDAAVSVAAARFNESVLLTHRGLSGPAILQISSYWKAGETITLEVPALPRRLDKTWRERYAPAKPQAQWSRKELDEFTERLHHWTLTPSGTEGYEKAEVTLGGVDTDDLSSKTMESRHVRGLYFIGEVVDVTGQLGGFNFQWAWASGFVAGLLV